MIYHTLFFTLTVLSAPLFPCNQLSTFLRHRFIRPEKESIKDPYYQVRKDLWKFIFWGNIEPVTSWHVDIFAHAPQFLKATPNVPIENVVLTNINFYRTLLRYIECADRNIQALLYYYKKTLGTILKNKNSILS